MSRPSRPVLSVLAGVGVAAVLGAAAVPTVSSQSAAPAVACDGAGVALSTLTPVSATNGWGPYELNESNGEQASGDGTPLTINGRQFSSGVGVHARSELTYDVSGRYGEFRSWIGVDDTEQNWGSVTFEVWVDGEREFNSSTMRGSDSARFVSVPVAGAQKLTLKVTDNADAITHDHGDWAGAELTCASDGNATTTTSPTSSSSSSTTTQSSTTTTTTLPTKPSTSSSSTTTKPPSSTSSTSASPSSPPSSSSSTTSSAAGFPNASTTGAKGALTLKTGSMDITQDGTTLSNVEIHGTVRIYGSNVTLKNVKIVSSEFWALRVDGRNVLLEDSTIVGGDGTQCSIVGGNWTGRRLDLYGAGDGIKMGANSQLYDSYIHDLSRANGNHNDGIEITNAPNTKVIHNTILNSNSQTSAVMISEFGSTSNSGVVISDNLIGGGGYTVYGGAPDTAQGHQVTNNLFTTRFFEDSGYYGPVAYWRSSGNTWSGNVWADGPNAGRSVNP